MTKMPPCIEKRGKNSYRLIVFHGYVAGKQQRYQKTVELPATMTERAQIKEAERLRALFYAEVVRGEASNANQMTVENFSREWMENDVKLKRLSDVTVADYQRTLDSHIIPALGTVKLQKITPLMLTKYYGELLRKDNARGRKISSRYVLHIHGVIRTMLNAAVRWGYLTKNPAYVANTPRSDTQEAAIFDDEQCTALLTHLERAPLQYRCAVTLALFSQIRKGELAGLDWRFVDFEKNTVSIRQSASYISGQGVILKSPKTKAGNRTITVPAFVMRLLKQLKTSQSEDRLKLGTMWQDSGAVFVTWEGRRLHPDTVPKWFTDFLKAKGLPHIRFHALRHTGASLLISEGEDVMTISRRLGHADAHTTLKTYAHSFEKHDKGASDKLEARLLGVVM